MSNLVFRMDLRVYSVSGANCFFVLNKKRDYGEPPCSASDFDFDLEAG